MNSINTTDSTDQENLADLEKSTIPENSPTSVSTMSPITITSSIWRFCMILILEIKRWLSSAIFWCFLLLPGGFSFFTTYGITRARNVQFSTHDIFLFALQGSLVNFSMILVLLSGIIAGANFPSRFDVRLQTFFQRPIQFMLNNITLTSIMSLIYGGILFISQWIYTQALWKSSYPDFQAPISAAHYIGCSVFSLILLGIITASLVIIFKNGAVGIVISFILTSGMLSSLFNFFPANWHLSAFLFNSTSLYMVFPSTIPSSSWHLTYWANVGVSIAWAAVAFIACVLVTIYAKNRQFVWNFIHLRKRKKDNTISVNKNDM